MREKINWQANDERCKGAAAVKIGIAGAGLMGRLLAWQLLRRGHAVTLFDADVIDGQRAAARVAAAMLSPYSEAVACEREIFEWGNAGLQRWPELLAQLAEEGGLPVYFQQRGSLVIAHRGDLPMLHHFNQLLRQRVPDRLDRVRFLEGDEVAEVEPELEGFNAGTLLVDEGTLDNRELLARLAEAIQRAGGEWWQSAPVARVEPGRLLLQQEIAGTAPAVFDCDLAIDTRGLGAKGQQPELRGVRGEVLWVHAPEVNLQRPVRLMHPRYQLYISPKRDNVYVIGATEIESESMAPITVRSSLELQSALYSTHRGFAEASILHAYANCRPAYPDNLPRLEVASGMMRANGLYRHGYLLAPVMLDLALAAAEGGITPHPIICAAGAD